jgi:hypothetical protein
MVVRGTTASVLPEHRRIHADVKLHDIQHRGHGTLGTIFLMQAKNQRHSMGNSHAVKEEIQGDFVHVFVT